MSYSLTKCFKCTKVISGQSREIGKRMFHFNCLTCGNCKAVLGGDDNGKIRHNRIFCKTCFTKRFRPRCDKQAIGEGDGLSTGGKTLHSTCFRCAGCQRPMGPGKRVQIKGEIYCQLKCQQDRVSREKAAANAQAAKNAPPPAPAPVAAEPATPVETTPEAAPPVEEAPAAPTEEAPAAPTDETPAT